MQSSNEVKNELPSTSFSTGGAVVRRAADSAAWGGACRAESLNPDRFSMGRWIRWLLCALLLNVLCPLHSANYETIDIEILRPRWLAYANQTYDPARQSLLTGILSNASGIYVDAPPAQSNSRLEKAVLVQVVESFGSSRSNSENYKQQMLNFFCYTKQMRLKSVLFVVSPDEQSFQADQQLYASFNPFVHVVRYPYHLFWSIVAAKQSNVTYGPGRGDYNDSYPSFPHFGALPMLVPVLEVLQMGYNAVYLDIDMVFLADPLPLLTRGTADIVLTPELKVCKFPSLSYAPHWAKIEPNTGTLFVVSSPRTVRFFRQWFTRIVEDNSMNDQRTMHLGQHKHSLWQRDCDMDPITRLIKERDGDVQEDGVRYCMLNEFLFFTGLMELFCLANRKKGVNPPQFNLAMTRFGLVYPSKDNASSPQPLGFDLYDLLERDLTQELYPYVHYPAVFHANYCGNKRRCFEDRGLWLLTAKQKCTSFDFQQTSYFRVNWTERVFSGQQALREGIAKLVGLNATTATASSLKKKLEGMVVRFPGQSTIYKVEEGHLRPFSSLQSFLYHKYVLGDVVMWSNEVLWVLPFGKPL